MATVQLAPAANISSPKLHEINGAVKFVLPIAGDLGLNKERLDFVYRFVFPPSHAELLPVRDSKKEREAYEQQEFEKTKKPPRNLREDEEDGRHASIRQMA